jgi:alpha-beta hydrolase superfamily lysophospholipase
VTASPLATAARHPGQNSLAVRGHVLVLPGRGETAALYRRFGERISYDGYTVTVAELPTLDALDERWLDEVAPPEDAAELGELILVGSDSGAVLAALLAERWDAGAVVLAGVGGLETAVDGADDEARIALRSSCPVHRGRLAEGADLTALATQHLAPAVAARLTTTRLTVPTLVLHGEDDAVTPLGAALGLVGGIAPAAHVVTIAGGVHDVLNDLPHRVVSAELVQFLEQRRRPVLTRHPAQAVGAAA